MQVMLVIDYEVSIILLHQSTFDKHNYCPSFMNTNGTSFLENYLLLFENTKLHSTLRKVESLS
jgi:hypothetical protein